MDCVFCKIVEGKIPAVKVSEKPSWIAIRDINPQAPQHILVFPKEHVPRLTAKFADGEVRVEYYGDTLLRVVADIAQTLGLTDYRIVINNGPGAGQEIPHLHAHILGGWAEGEWPRIVGEKV